FREYGERGFAGVNLRLNERAPLLHVQRVGLHQPDMAVNPRALIKPAIALGGIDSPQQDVALAEKGEIRHVKGEGILAATVPPDVETVEQSHGLAIRAI